MNIRRRLSILYAVVWAGIYLIFTLVLYSSFKYHLGVEVDQSLAAWSVQIRDSEDVGRRRGAGSPRPPADLSPRFYDMPDSFVVVFDDEGGMLINRSAFSEWKIEVLRRFATDVAQEGRAKYGRIAVGGQWFRILGTRVADRPDARGYTILLGRSLVHVERTQEGLALSLLFAWMLAVLVCSTVMWVFVGQTLRPIHRMTVNALEIAGSGELGRRIEDHGGKDEFSGLARALNRMLTSMQASSESQQQFLADVSHELRTPLTSMRANLQFIRMAAGASEADRAAALRDSIAEADRMAALVNDLLQLARAGALPPRGSAKTDLAVIAAEASAAFRDGRTVSKRQFRLELPEEPACVVGNGKDLRQAIEMLLDNAFKYTPEGGSITLRLAPAGEKIMVTLEDDGPGIPLDEIGSVFDRFYRSSNVREKVPGSGLGLPIVRSIIQHHGGSIELKNREPHGLSVSISLPACL